MRTVDRDIVSALLFSKDGKILQLLQASDGRAVYPGCWGLIGGGMDEGEDQRTALDREIMEETGIDISRYPAELVHESSGEAEKVLKETGERVFAKMKFHTYKVVVDDREARDVPVTLGDEHTAHKWSTVSELKDLELPPPSIELYKKLGYIH